jgi:hypothetical protein
MWPSQPTSKELTVNKTQKREIEKARDFHSLGHHETAARILAICQRCALTKRAQQDIIKVVNELDLMRFMRIENGCLITD